MLKCLSKGAQYGYNAEKDKLARPVLLDGRGSSHHPSRRMGSVSSAVTIHTERSTFKNGPPYHR